MLYRDYPELVNLFSLSIKDLNAEGLSQFYALGGKGYRHQIDRKTYISVRMPATYAAAQFVFNQRVLMPYEPKSILDVGCGPGTASLAALKRWPFIEQITLIDQDREMVNLAQNMLNLVAPNVRVAAIHTQWPSKVDKHDLAVSAYMFSEMSLAGHIPALERLTKVAENLCIILSGRPKDYELLMNLRKQLINLNRKIYAPCPHQLTCPMQGSAKWCHFSARLPRASLHRRVKSAELSFEDEKFSYLIAGPDNQYSINRIVDTPQFRKGMVRLSLCTQAGMLKEEIITRKEEFYRRARDLKWGDELNEKTSPLSAKY